MKLPSLNHKSILKLLLKLVFAFAILYWLISENKLDYRLVLLSFKNPISWIGCFTLMSIQIFLGALRWRMILETHITNISLKDILRIQWIGQFFSVVLPGAVTGDLIKIGYINSLKKKQVSKKFLLLSIFIDRLSGLSSLLLLAGISSVLFYNDLVALNPILKNVIYINVTLLFSSCAILTLFFLNKKHQHIIKKLLPAKRIKNLLETIWSFSDHKKEMIRAILISLLTHILMIAAFWIINLPFFEKSVQLKYLLSLIPLGQVAVALPLSPAGLGVGHAAFDRLFHFIGHGNGASLFNVYWVVSFAANLCGIFPFIFSKSQATTHLSSEGNIK